MLTDLWVPLALFFGVSVIGTFILGGSAAKLVESQRKQQR